MLSNEGYVELMLRASAFVEDLRGLGIDASITLRREDGVSTTITNIERPGKEQT